MCHEYESGLINARSVTKKIPLIHNLIDEYDLKCLAITETWLKASCSDTAILDVAPPGYSIHYTHRPGEKSGGGVAIVAHKSLNAKPINLQYNYSSFESVVVRLSVSNNKRLNVVVLYRPPRSADFVNEIHMLIQESASMRGETIIVGDFNSPSSASGDLIDTDLNFAIESENFANHVTEPTHSANNILDLVLSSQLSNIVQSITVNDVSLSDHLLVIANLSCSFIHNPPITFAMRNYKRLDVNEFRMRLSKSTFVTNPPQSVNDYANMNERRDNINT